MNKYDMMIALNRKASEEKVALAQQGNLADPRKSILDMAMNAEIVQLQKQLATLQRENESLRMENEKLKKAVKSRNESMLRRL